MQSIADKNSFIDGVVESQMPIAVARHVQNLERAVVVNSDMFAAHKSLVDALCIANHLSHPGTGFGVKTQAHAMIGNPLVIARSIKAIGILDHQPVLLSASQQCLTGDLLERCVAPVVIGIGMGVDCPSQSRRLNAHPFKKWIDRLARSIRSARIQQDRVIANKQVLEKIAVSDERGDLIYVSEDFHNTVPPGTRNEQPRLCSAEAIALATRLNPGRSEHLAMPRAPAMFQNATRTILNLNGNRQQFC